MTTLTTMKINTLESAPQESKAAMEQAKKSFGLIPNLHGVLATSPKTYEAYRTLHKLFQESSFNNDELTVVWQTINVENECHYCVPAHTAIGHMMKVDADITEALRNGTTLPNEKLQALHETTLKIVKNRGRLSQEDLDKFYGVGYGEQQVLEILLGLAQKTISNYTNHIANTPVDEPFQKFAWSK